MHVYSWELGCLTCIAGAVYWEDDPRPWKFSKVTAPCLLQGAVCKLSVNFLHWFFLLFSRHWHLLGTICLREIIPSPPVGMYPKLKVQSHSPHFPPATTPPFPMVLTLLKDRRASVDFSPYELAWVARLQLDLAQVSLPTLPAEEACGSGGWETAHWGPLQLLPAATQCRCLLIGSESSLLQFASSWKTRQRSLEARKLQLLMKLGGELIPKLQVE